ncbi:hypothetical protein Ddc_14182 [Ditylenchus destructor]|nr:hypothetical protein Ddc_14182 [Ditylenchus destructor]
MDPPAGPEASIAHLTGHCQTAWVNVYVLIVGLSHCDAPYGGALLPDTSPGRLAPPGYLMPFGHEILLGGIVGRLFCTSLAAPRAHRPHLWWDRSWQALTSFSLSVLLPCMGVIGRLFIYKGNR